MTTQPIRRASGVDVVLYDGACALCRASVAKLTRWLPREKVVAISFREPGALDRFREVDAQSCERAVQLVRDDGRVFSGAEAFVQLWRRRPLGLVLRAYYLPGVRQVVDLFYRAVAAHRGSSPGEPR